MHDICLTDSVVTNIQNQSANHTDTLIRKAMRAKSCCSTKDIEIMTQTHGTQACTALDRSVRNRATNNKLTWKYSTEVNGSSH